MRGARLLRLGRNKEYGSVEVAVFDYLIDIAIGSVSNCPHRRRIP
jgi:hypothetical protein